MKHPMKLIEGNEATRVRVYSYRGHRIVSRARSGDARNKAHPGYDWHVELKDGSGFRIVLLGGRPTRANAKLRIDRESQ